MTLALTPPQVFSAFPYSPPYPIQAGLMHHLYECIEHKKVSIVESPTGTGKTLSLLCASLTWLADEKDRARKGKMVAYASDNGPDWVIAQTMERHRRELEAGEAEYEERLASARKKEASLKKMAKARVTKKPKLNHDKTQPSDPSDDAFLPEDGALVDDKSTDNISPALRALMAKVDQVSNRGPKPDEPEPTCTKIYYASRTHSQLSQILPELGKLKLQSQSNAAVPVLSDAEPPSLGRKRPDGEISTDDELRPQWRAVSLGSRKQLCINDELRARVGDLDEKCRELLGEKKENRCQHLPPVDEDSKMVDFRDQILASPKDIEDLAAAGRLAHACPYFGSRRAIPQAELVTLPYNLLLQKTAREALGIDLTNQIVIIDEAHNLISTILSLATTRVPFHTLDTSLSQVSIYLTKFRTRLSANHVLHLKRLITFLEALKRYSTEWLEAAKGKKQLGGGVEVMTVAELMQRVGRKAESINMLEIESYVRSSKIARKISGYSDKLAETAAGQDPAKLAQVRRGATPPLHVIESFMLALTSANDDGRVCFSVTGQPNQEQVEIRYQLLNPSTPFRDVVDAARSVILAGGTMSPISDVVAQLFSHLPQDRLSNFTCGHIIPSTNLQTLVVCRGPRGADLEFKFDRRGDKSMIAELGQILSNFINVVPGGMVAFFPSYSFLNTVKAEWTTSGTMEKFNAKKKVFLEPQETTDVESVLRDYAAACHTSKLSADKGAKGGALLFAVIGAKLSEGLNFSDNLARAVVIIGLPFANLSSPELRERMKYVNRLEAKSNVQKKFGQKDAAAELYENMCMNAVNQSIGRAIRHRDDWASLILIDRRYASTPLRNKLPQWIGEGTVITESFGVTMKHMGEFFRNKRTLPS
ncbi:hypothetical protein PILCRDRAFT_812883 [Piloderma croceum F 1598]|uniref:ATP-dependent DNA helicase CHL1 n=1 Tax=Piloderma croceum (strain F 1598) TaxID=765440 RepID=A0A0C3GED5_PILCF|nr:hypothetical protein PILCRDRAFT_812883 [Piloderma croceum F 1598]